MKLSVIVPVYNVEKTLQRCIDSIINQNLEDYEIIIVDDGSTDSSGMIAEEISLHNDNISVFHKENRGLSDARNYGMSKASGEYITFVDSDDEVGEGTYKALTAIIVKNKHCDILEYPVLGNPGRKDEYLFNPGEKEYDNALEWLSEFGTEHCWAWNKVYKKSFIENMYFPLGKHYEDVYFTAEYLKKKPYIITTDKGFYKYYYNDKGITSNKGLNKLLEAQIYLVKTLGINTRDKEWHRLYLNLLTSQLHSYCNSPEIILWNQKLSLRKYTKSSDIIKSVVLNIFGLKLSCILFKLIK